MKPLMEELHHLRKIFFFSNKIRTLEQKVNFNITIGNLSEIIVSKSHDDKVTSATNFSNSLIPINDNFIGMVLEFQLDQKVIRDGSIKFQKQYQWDEETSKIFTLSRHQFIINGKNFCIKLN